MSPSAYKVVQRAVFALLVLAMSALPALPVRAAGWDDVEAAWAADKRGQYEDSVKLATRGIKSGKLKGIRLARAYVTRGSSYQSMKQLRAAGADYDSAIKLVDKTIRSGGLSGKDLAYAYNTRAISHKGMGRFQEAVADYSVALKILPRFHKFLLNRGSAYISLRRYELAIADYSAVLEAKPDSFNLYHARAGARVWQGNHEKAIADYDQALAINPENPFRWAIHLGRGNANFLKGDYGQAIADYEKSLALNPRYKGTKQRIAKAREAMKRAARPGYTSGRELWAGVELERPGDEN